MIRAGTSYSDRSKAKEAAEIAGFQALANSGATHADFAFVFATANYKDQYPEILKTVKHITGARAVAGSSAFGVITDQRELDRQPGLAVMTVTSDEIEAMPFVVKNLQENNFKAGENLGGLIREKMLFPSMVVAFPDSFSFDGSLFFDGLDSSYGYLPMVGGTSTDDGSENKVYQMQDLEATFDAVSGIALGGNVRFETGISQSCLPFGEPLQVTRCDGNLIYEIEGRPAYDIFLEHLTQVESENVDKAFQNIFLGLPIKSFQTDFTKSQFLVRNIMSVNAQKGMLTCVAPVEQGEFVTFAVRDARRATHDMEHMLTDLKERLGHQRPAFGLYFNCCARGQALYRCGNRDVTMIRRFFPGVPIIGFFTYGEIAPVDFINHLHHYSGSLTLITGDQ